MSDLQAAKDLIRAHHAAIAAADADGISDALARHTAPDWHWRGTHPFHEHHGAEAVAEAFWRPFLAAMGRVQRRPDIFLAGLNAIDDRPSVWVAQMGHLLTLFDHPWLGIRPTRRIAMLRFAEFHKVESGRITETAQFLDLPHLMAQAGQYPFPPQTGAELVQPGPLTHDGLLWGPQDPALAPATLAAIDAMLADLAARRDGTLQVDAPTELARTWHDDMVWWGPSGIGATWTIPRYLEQHAGPFRAAMYEGARFRGHVCKIAEGRYGGFFGWPSLTVRNSGGFMGLPAGPEADLRVVDLYRVQDGKLAENWVFIDLLHWLNQQGLDVLARMETL